jgi:hypothetical protein
MASPLTIDLSEIPTSDLAREMQRRNPNKNATTKFRDCRFCGLPFAGVRKLWDHMRVCEKNPHDKGWVYRPCPHCGKQFSARILRLHGPECDKNPRVIARAEREAAARRKAAEK